MRLLSPPSHPPPPLIFPAAKDLHHQRPSSSTPGRRRWTASAAPSHSDPAAGFLTSRHRPCEHHLLSSAVGLSAPPRPCARHRRLALSPPPPSLSGAVAASRGIPIPLGTRSTRSPAASLAGAATAQCRPSAPWLLPCSLLITLPLSPFHKWARPQIAPSVHP